ncbi:MAG: nucleotidyl transferase AbiEii/AbiGii toxin family protein [Candidatus Roizmanbacteria bacterium]|nr:nucleotidyl transferase AbiEii/AbiGii toxin family protein [Candidatus Roizmanbacteria bacterium]
MLSNDQIGSLAIQNKIDTFTILREYVQIRFLTELFQLPNTQTIFKGGTAMRLMYGSPRYSEDLDFDAIASVKETKEDVKSSMAKLKKEMPDLSVKDLKSVAGLSFKIYLGTEISPQKLTVKLDFSFREKDRKRAYEKRPIQTVFPVQNFTLINVLSKEQILTDKICTLFTRFKGRDLYDTWYLLNTGTKLNTDMVEDRLNNLFGISFSYDILRQNIHRFDTKKLEQDLNKFLPMNQRAILANLKQFVLEMI